PILSKNWSLRTCRGGSLDTGARLFCVPRADILAEQVAARYIASLAAIARAARFPGPFIYTVHPSKIVRVL
ncbi:hypothetical protein T612_03839, partial [Mycobacterium tuberculosis UT0096]